MAQTFLSVPDLGSPALQGKSVPFSIVWANFLQEVARRIGSGGATADLEQAGMVLLAELVSDPATSDVTAAPASYNQTWGIEVVTLLNEVKANQIAILDALKAAGVMNDV